jgi:drug/metabolite transporter (DMT)-like permease
VSVVGVPGLGLLLAAATAFGAVSVLAKHAYESGSEPVSLLGVRLLVAALALTATIGGAPGTGVDRRALALATLAGLAFAGAGLGEFEALSRAAAAAPVRTAAILAFPEMSLLRGDPRLDQLRKRFNLR